MTLKNLIKSFRDDSLDSDHWLYLGYSCRDINLESEAEFAEKGFDESTGCETFPSVLLSRGLHATLNYEEILECIAHSDRLAGFADDEAVADVIRYAVRFDRLPASLRAPDPAGVIEQKRGPVSELYDSLGAEDQSKPCQSKGCSRGSVRYSVFCRTHHCESVLGYLCPLTH